MKFGDLDLIDAEDFNLLFYLNNIFNLKEEKKISDFKKFINILKNFDSYDEFYEFVNIIKSIPTIEQVDELTKLNQNLYFFEFLKSFGYFDLLDKEQKYHLFTSACSYDSIDIAMLIFDCGIDLEGVKEFMINYLIQVGGNSEYVIFRKLWEKNIFEFNPNEIEEIFLSILKSSNLEFVQWFYSLNLINLMDSKIKNKIGYDVLEKASTNEDFQVAKFICSYYSNLI